MSQFKMVCLDIDGTLLNSRHKISPKTKETIQLVVNEKHIPVILVSSRLPKGMLFLLEEMDIVQPIICYSGSLILDSDRNIILNEVISVDDVKRLYELVRGNDIHFSLYKDDQWIEEDMDQWVKQESEITKTYPDIVKYTDLFDTWNEKSTGPNKILCMAEPDRIQFLMDEIKKERFNDLNVYPSKPTYLEIMPINASKSSAIEFLRKKFDVQRSEIIAIGDNYNDIDMIEYAGLGIAMGNAPEPVKKLANYVTLTNDDDGVAEALRKWLLEYLQ